VVGILCAITAYILAPPLFTGSMIVIRRKLRGEGRIDLGEVFNQGFKYFGPTFILSFLTFLIWVIVGGILFVLSWIPFIGFLFSIVLTANGLMIFLIAVYLTIAYHFIAEENLSFSDAGSASWGIIKRDFFMFWVLGLLWFLIMFAGVIACGIGILITAPVGAVMANSMLEHLFPPRR
jgi:hypothetical protein